MNKGISLIVLVITIVVMLILTAAITISLSKNNPISQASEAKFKNNIAEYNNALSMYISTQYTNNNGNYSIDNLNALTVSEVQNIIPNITSADASKIKIVKGQLSYIGSDQNEIDWAKQANISLNIPYVKSDMILWYDGINNGGLGTHNDNTSVNKGIWKDLSGANNDGTLQSFDYNSSNGWISNGLRFDGKPNLVNFNLNIQNKHTVEFVVVCRKSAYNGVFSVASNLSKTYTTGVHIGGFLFYNTSLVAGSNYGSAGLNYTKQSLFTMTFDMTAGSRNLYQNTIAKAVTNYRRRTIW